MTLTEAEGVDFSGTFFGPLSSDPISVGWSTADKVNNTQNGVFARLIFNVKDNAAVGEYPIKVTYTSGEIYNVDLDDVLFSTVDGTVKITNYLPGDVNDDGTVNMKDVTTLQRYIVGWNVKINVKAANCDGNGEITMKDLSLLQRYISGWDVVLA